MYDLKNAFVFMEQLYFLIYMHVLFIFIFGIRNKIVIVLITPARVL